MRPTTPTELSPVQAVLLDSSGGGVVDTTLLELVQVVSEVTDDDREVVATVVHLLRSGRVRLNGNFRGTIPDAA